MEKPATIQAWEAADRRQDLDQMKAQLAANVRLISPLTDAFTFDGPDEVMAVFESAFELLRDIVIYKVTGSDRDWVLYGKNTLKGKNLEEIQWLHLDERDMIDEITLFVRPLVAGADLLARMGPPLAKRGVMHTRWAGFASFLGRMPHLQIAMAEKTIMPRLKKGE